MAELRSTDAELTRTTITMAVAELAHLRGVSERTVWRWSALARAGRPSPISDHTCANCGHPLPDDASSRRRYCNDYCRVRAHRQRRRRAKIADVAGSSTRKQGQAAKGR
jgi:hypothetical protein